jgi:hypothetical protein
MAGTPRVLTQDGQGGRSDGILRTKGKFYICLYIVLLFYGLWILFSGLLDFGHLRTPDSPWCKGCVYMVQLSEVQEY